MYICKNLVQNKKKKLLVYLFLPLSIYIQIVWLTVKSFAVSLGSIFLNNILLSKKTLIN